MAVVAWCRLHPDERRMALHIPNEAKRSLVGHVIQKRKGVIKGAADLLIPAARGGWHGLWLELKRADEKPTEHQLAFGQSMTTCGYAWAWADTVDKAIAIISQYMASAMPRPNWAHYEAPVASP